MKESIQSERGLSQHQYETAVTEGDLIVKELSSDIKATERWCAEILQIVNERISQGEEPMKKHH